MLLFQVRLGPSIIFLVLFEPKFRMHFSSLILATYPTNLNDSDFHTLRIFDEVWTLKLLIRDYVIVSINLLLSLP